MGRPKLPKPVLKVGDFIFAKTQGYRPWPGRVAELHKGNWYSVYFYGTSNHARVHRDKIFTYEKHQDRLGFVRGRPLPRNSAFRNSMTDVREAFASPSEDDGFFTHLAAMREKKRNQHVIYIESDGEYDNVEFDESYFIEHDMSNENPNDNGQLDEHQQLLEEIMEQEEQPEKEKQKKEQLKKKLVKKDQEHLEQKEPPMVVAVDEEHQMEDLITELVVDHPVSPSF